MRPVLRSLPAFLLSLSTLAATDTGQPSYRIIIDITRCHDDRIHVTVIPPASLRCSPCRYVMPRSVPGTYSLDRYGRFIVNARALDAIGRDLPLERDDDGDIIIASTPARLEYWVNDTWDDSLHTGVFNPTGSNIECDTNIVLNFHAFVGYLDGAARMPYEVTIHKPPAFYGATSLRRIASTDTTDYFVARTYMELVDNPAMYCTPDTTSFDVSGTRITVAVYSPNKVMTSISVAESIKPVLASVVKMLGSMPVDSYTFLLYFAGRLQRNITRGMSFGALEHSRSSFYFLPEGRGAETTAREMIQSTAAHEFLHILMPLHLHSEEIEYFDFRNPRMSRHLWLYEGCTEYFQLLARTQDTLLEPEQFLRAIISYFRMIRALYQQRQLSLVELSQRILQDDYHRLYPVIYMHGPVVAFCLDVTIRKLTDGRMDLLSTLRTLMSKYGPERPFRDEELFDEITSLVHPSLRDFFRRYIEGTDLPPLAECLTLFGYRYQDTAQVEMYEFPTGITLSRASDIPIVVVRNEDATFGFHNGDTLVSINDTPVTIENKFELVSRYIWAPRSGDTVRIVVRRGSSEIELRAAPRKKYRTVRHSFSADPSTPEKALQFRRLFFRKNW